MIRKKMPKRDYLQILFVFMAFALMVTISGLFVSNTLQKSSLTAVTMALGETEKTIQAYLREPKVAFDSTYTAIQDILDRGGSREEVHQYLVQTTEMLRTQEDGITGFITVYGYILDELLVGIEVNLASDYVPQQRPWYQLAVRSEGVAYTVPYIDAFTGAPIISLAQEIYGINGDYYGVLALDVDISWLMKYAESLQFVSGGYGMIVTQHLFIITHPKEQFMEARLQDLGDSYAVIADMLRVGRDVSAMRIQDYDGTSAIVFFKELFNGWYIGVVMPSAGYYADLYLTITLLTVLGVVLAGILSYILLRISSEKNRSAEASKAKSSFLATMSHEIRTPLNAIIGVAQIELQKEHLPDEVAAVFHKIYGSGNNLLGIINDILDMSKIETGKLELNPAEYDLPSLINDTVQLNIVRIGSKPLNFVLEIDENLPSRMYGDELRIKQILNNLLSNAIKYTEKGYVKLSVRHWAENGDVMLNFSVEDTGQGMKLDDRTKFFSEYQRFNTDANRATEGTGLGLSITKELVEMMDGTIWVESEYGKGSIFLVAIKQKAVECEAIGPELAWQLCSFTFTTDRRSAKLQIACEPMPYGRVLIVDDVDTNLYVAEGLLSPYRLTVDTASSGFEAIEKVENGKKYDIIFMDHMMPQMDGVETTQKLRGLGYKDVIIALTANALVGNDELFIKRGFDGFIPKPIDVRQLNVVLNRFIRDRYPEEAKKYKPETSVQSGTDEIDPKVLQIFRSDAEKAVAALREATAGGDIKLLTTTAHAMKAALANIGESEASGLAAELESAGQRGDTEYISANTERVVQVLEALIKKLGPPQDGALDGASDGADMEEDTVYLAAQLQIIKAACEAYDDDAAYAALDRLKQSSWSSKTSGELERLRDALFIYSDFDGAAEMAGRLTPHT